MLISDEPSAQKPWEEDRAEDEEEGDAAEEVGGLGRRGSGRRARRAWPQAAPRGRDAPPKGPQQPRQWGPPQRRQPRQPFDRASSEASNSPCRRGPDRRSSRCATRMRERLALLPCARVRNAPAPAAAPHRCCSPAPPCFPSQGGAAGEGEEDDDDVSRQQAASLQPLLFKSKGSNPHQAARQQLSSKASTPGRHASP